MVKKREALTWTVLRITISRSRKVFLLCGDSNPPSPVDLAFHDAKCLVAGVISDVPEQKPSRH